MPAYSLVISGLARYSGEVQRSDYMYALPAMAAIFRSARRFLPSTFFGPHISARVSSVVPNQVIRADDLARAMVDVAVRVTEKCSANSALHLTLNLCTFRCVGAAS